MKKEYNKGFTLIELIIVMVLLGILAAVAVPRMSNTIRSAEESAEQKFMGNLVSALEVYSSDEVVKGSVKKFPSNPFIALDKWPDGNVWQFDEQINTLRHFRNGFDGDLASNEVQTWTYYSHDPGSTDQNGDSNCYATTQNDDGSYNDQPSPHGCYEIVGPGFAGNNDDGTYNNGNYNY